MRNLTKYRLEKAAEVLQESKILLDTGSFGGSLNRSYYALFTAVRALLSEREIDFKKHSAVISYFRQNYIKTGIFDAKFSQYIGDAFEIRNKSDYGDFYIASRLEAEVQYNHAVEFYETVKNFLEGGES